MQPLDKFMSRLLPQVPGCPDPLALQALLDSAIEFCEETGVVQSSSVQDLYEGRSEYDADISSGVDVSRLLYATVGGRELTLVSHTPSGDARGHPRYACMNSYGGVSVYPVPEDTQAQITLRVVTRPKRTAKALEDVLFFQWVEAVVAGAAYRLASIPGQPFTDQNLAASSFGRSLFFLNRGRLEARRQGSTVNIRVRNHPFA